MRLEPAGLGGSTASSGQPRAERRVLAAALVLGVAFVFAYGSVLHSLARTWWSNTMYSYGFLIPVISGYLAWTQRATLTAVERRAAPVAGMSLLAIGIGTLMAGDAASVLSLQHLSLLATLAGVVVMLFGVAVLRALWLPLAYLLFMMPIWDVVTDRLHLPFQMVSARLGVSLLHLTGVPAYRHDIFIELPRVTLEIAEVCSGVNYLIAVVALGVPLAYLCVDGLGRRVLLVGGAVAVAAVSNGLRVAFIGWLAYVGWAGDIHGPFHVLQGLFVSVIGYVVLFAGAGILSAQRGSRPWLASGGEPRGGTAIKADAWRRMLVLAGLLTAAGVAVNYWRPVVRPLAQSLETFPYRVGEWAGVRTGGDAELRESMSGGGLLVRRYSSAEGDVVDLYVAYLAAQTQGRELAGDRFRQLMRDARPVTLEAGEGRSVELAALVRPGRDSARYAAFWYVVDGRAVPSAYEAKLWTAWSALTRRRTDGAVVVVTSTIAPGGTADSVPVAVARFIREGLPVLADFLSRQ